MKLSRKVIIIIAGLIIGIVASALAAWNTLRTQAPSVQACTEEALICPDGSAVGRTQPNCAFANCPS